MENPNSFDRPKAPVLSREEQNTLDEATRRASAELGVAASRDELSKRALELLPAVQLESSRDTLPPPPPSNQ
jgi:hypothetical protein